MVLYRLGRAEASMIFAGRARVGDLGPPLHEPGGARLRRALIPIHWIRARRSLAPPFIVPMRAKNGVRAAHEPLVAADVSRRTCLVSRQRISADSRRRLRFRGSTYKIFVLELRPMNMSDRDRPVPTDRGALPSSPCLSKLPSRE